VQFVIKGGAVNLKNIRDWFQLSRVLLDGVCYPDDPDGWSVGSDFKDGDTVTVTGAAIASAAAAQPQPDSHAAARAHTASAESTSQPGMGRQDLQKLLASLGATLSERMALLNMQSAQAAINGGLMTQDIAIGMLADVRARMKTSTKLHIANNQGILLDGHIMVQGQSISALYHAFWQARVVCAKVYSYVGPRHAAARAAASREARVSQDVHAQCACPSLIQVEAFIETANHGLIVLPLLGKSCSDLLSSIIGGLPADAANPYVASICISVLSAIAALARLGLCHADIKPSNIMLPSHKGGYATLVDLASCTPYGQPLAEITPIYSLGLTPQVASLKWDLVCLACTLYECGGGEPRALDTWQQLQQVIASAPKCTLPFPSAAGADVGSCWSSNLPTDPRTLSAHTLHRY